MGGINVVPVYVSQIMRLPFTSDHKGALFYQLQLCEVKVDHFVQHGGFYCYIVIYQDFFTRKCNCCIYMTYNCINEPLKSFTKKDV